MVSPSHVSRAIPAFIRSSSVSTVDRALLHSALPVTSFYARGPHRPRFSALSTSRRSSAHRPGLLLSLSTFCGHGCRWTSSLKLGLLDLPRSISLPRRKTTAALYLERRPSLVCFLVQFSALWNQPPSFLQGSAPLSSARRTASSRCFSSALSARQHLLPRPPAHAPPVHPRSGNRPPTVGGQSSGTHSRVQQPEGPSAAHYPRTDSSSHRHGGRTVPGFVQPEPTVEQRQSQPRSAETPRTSASSRHCRTSATLRLRNQERCRLRELQCHRTHGAVPHRASSSSQNSYFYSFRKCT